MDFKQLAKNLATETAKTVAGKATDVIDSSRDQLVADFEQAVARQRAEFIPLGFRAHHSHYKLRNHSRSDCCSRTRHSCD